MTLCVGGSGFIGSHLCATIGAVSFDLREGNDAHDLAALTAAMRGHETVVHLASNADIAAAAVDPMVDFNEGTVLTANVCEAARLAGVRTILYASGSGVYGRPVDASKAFCETDPCIPVSPYGASKIAGESLLCAYSHMFGIRAIAFRFANVVGPGQTHGVGYDFMRKLRADPTRLEILGDGRQCKSYLSVNDAIEAMQVALYGPSTPFEAYNVASDDQLTVREIADMASGVVTPSGFVDLSFAPGWAGDVTEVRLDSSKIRSLGWEPSLSSREAMRWALENLVVSVAETEVQG
jgi:UDP-glucose 4-epimerase